MLPATLAFALKVNRRWDILVFSLIPVLGFVITMVAMWTDWQEG